jgi:hypothetical protein
MHHIYDKNHPIVCFRDTAFLCTTLLSMFLDFRKVRHKNVVQFIGACTKPPNLCIVTGIVEENGRFKLSIFLLS